MILAQFFIQNAHFALNLITSLVFLAVFWIYFDAWSIKKLPKEGFKALGFLFLSLSFLLHATLIERLILVEPLLNANLTQLVTFILRVGGYLSLAYGLFLEPMIERPKTQSLRAVLFIGSPSLFSPPLAALVGLLYLKQIRANLAWNQLPLVWAFFGLAASELISLASSFRETDNIFLSNLVRAFGPLWIIEHLLLLAVSVVLVRWFWGLLLKRLLTQLLLTFTLAVLLIFLLTSVIFTGLLLKNVQETFLTDLETSARVLNLAIESKKAETLSTAQLVSQNEAIRKAVVEDDRAALKSLTASFLLTKKEDFLWILNADGAVLMRAEDPDRTGDSLSEDTLVKRAIVGESLSAIAVREGVLAPEVSVRSSTPLTTDGRVAGVVVAGKILDNAFVDGIKGATKLDASIYGGNTRSATTYLAPDGKSRLIGIKEETPAIKETVLNIGGVFTGSVEILHLPYFASFAPLNDADNNPAGMLFVGTEEIKVLQAAGRSIELTFFVAAALLALSILPAYLTARNIASQLA